MPTTTAGPSSLTTTTVLVGTGTCSRASIFETEHPVVRVHPETGRPTLLLGGFARQIVGFPSDVSRDLLRIFASYVTRPEHIVRWRWRPGDVAIWDNRATQHYAVNDYGDAHRVVQRVTVSGVRPVGLDGWQSEARSGDASSYQAGLGAHGGHLGGTDLAGSPVIPGGTLLGAPIPSRRGRRPGPASPDDP